MLIYLLRHGQAEQRAVSDAARELTAEGVAQTHTVVQQFAARKPRIDRALMSPLRRAQQTAALVTKVLPALTFAVEPDLQPETDVITLCHKIESMDAHEVLLVGHNPLLTNLLAWLVDGSVRATRPVGTSQLYCIDMDFFAPGCGEILYTLEP